MSFDSIINADEELRCRNFNRKIEICTIITALVTPAAIITLFPVLSFAWFGLASTVSLLFSKGNYSVPLFFGTLLISYLLFSFVVWLAIKYLDHKKCF